jgi:SAM-dependent methyltransferase
LPPPYAVRQCRSCGFEYLSPRPTRDELIRDYVGHAYYSPERLARRPHRREFDEARLTRLERWVRPPGTMLAVAAMEGGWWMENARRRGWRLTGVEFIPTLFETEPAKRVEMVRAPLWDLDVLDGRRFDAIHTVGLEHVPDVLATLTGFRRLLASGGVVVIEAPNQFEGLKERFKGLLLAILGDRILGTFHGEAAPWFHLSFFTPRTLRDALERSGFDVLETRTYLPWNPIYHATRRLRRLREASFFVGGLLGRGPSAEVIARPRAESLRGAR